MNPKVCHSDCGDLGGRWPPRAEHALDGIHMGEIIDVTRHLTGFR